MHNFAAIFDWDGVIIDSSRQHEAAWLRLAREEQRQLPPNFFLRSFGMKNERVISQLFGWTNDAREIERLSYRKESFYRDMVRAEGIAPLPGVVDFLNRLKNGNIPCAVGSSTPGENISCVIDLLGVREFFQAIVCAEDVKQGKPNPEVFLLAAQKLNAAPAKCVVFEDAHVGIEAARAGGMKVVAVSTTHPADTLSDADRIVAKLDQIQLSDLAELWE